MLKECWHVCTDLLSRTNRNNELLCQGQKTEAFTSLDGLQMKLAEMINILTD
jgi:hypothetical protein